MTRGTIRGRRAGRLFTAAVAVSLFGGVAAGDGEHREPLDLGIAEHARRSMVQVDVTVRGEPELVRNLTREDFELVVGGRFLEQFTTDRLCGAVSGDGSASGPDEPAPDVPGSDPSAVGGSTYLFYFDQAHLTLEGRQRSIDVARELVERLVGPTDRATIVSAADEIRVFAEETSDRTLLFEALDELEHDRRQWDFYPSQEEDRVASLVRTTDGGLTQGGTLEEGLQAARALERDESWRTEKALHRFEIVLGRLATAEPPKAVLYFADTMRAEPGKHYLYLFPTTGKMPLRDRRRAQQIELGAFSSSNGYEGVIDAANALGARLYTVQAAGLVGIDLPSYAAANARLTNMRSEPVPSAARLRDAQNALVGWSAETGGRAFLDGIPAHKIARRIAEDMSCVYLLSFDASAVPRGQPLRNLVRVKRAGVTASARGRLYVPTESERLTARLLSAFVTPSTGAGDGPGLAGTLVPTGFDRGAYAAVVQLVVPPSLVPGAAWDAGVSLVSRGRVIGESAARVVPPRAGEPMAIQVEVTIPPGEYELVTVAHDVTTDRVLSGRVEGTLPDPREAEAAIVSLAIVEPAAALLLGEDTRPTRAAFCDAHCRLRAEAPAALVGLVCGGHGSTSLHAHREIVGLGLTTFPPIEVILDDGPCVQLRDVVPGGTLTEGRFAYRVLLLDREREAARAETAFWVSSQTTAPPRAADPR
jgi:VWFA-related protein